MISRRSQLIVGAGVAVVLLAVVVRGVDWSELGHALLNARPLPLAGVVLASIAAYWVRAQRWGKLLAPLGRVRGADLFSATMVGFACSFVVPRSGELIRPWLISRRHAVTTSAGFATIVVERLLDLITVLALFGIYLFALPRAAEHAQTWLISTLTVGGGVAALIAAGLLAFLLALHINAKRVVGTIDRLLARAWGWLARPLGRLMRNFTQGLAVLSAPLADWVRIGSQSIVLWLLTALSFHLTQVAFGIDLPFQTTFLLLAFLAVGESIPTPGLVGGFHAFYVLALSEVYGIDKIDAVAASIAAHALTILPVLLIGLALLGREGLDGKRLRAVEESAPTHPS